MGSLLFQWSFTMEALRKLEDGPLGSFEVARTIINRYEDAARELAEAQGEMAIAEHLLELAEKAQDAGSKWVPLTYPLPSYPFFLKGPPMDFSDSVELITSVIDWYGVSGDGFDESGFYVWR
jgi:hypothetical protein